MPAHDQMESREFRRADTSDQYQIKFIRQDRKCICDTTVHLLRWNIIFMASGGLPTLLSRCLERIRNQVLPPRLRTDGTILTRLRGIRMSVFSCFSFPCERSNGGATGPGLPVLHKRYGLEEFTLQAIHDFPPFFTVVDAGITHRRAQIFAFS